MGGQNDEVGLGGWSNGVKVVEVGVGSESGVIRWAWEGRGHGGSGRVEQ